VFQEFGTRSTTKYQLEKNQTIGRFLPLRFRNFQNSLKKVRRTSYLLPLRYLEFIRKLLKSNDVKRRGIDFELGNWNQHWPLIAGHFVGHEKILFLTFWGGHCKYRSKKWSKIANLEESISQSTY